MERSDHDKPQDPTEKISCKHMFWNYLVLINEPVIALNIVRVCLVVFGMFFMPLREITRKLSDTGNTTKKVITVENIDDAVNRQSKLNIPCLRSIMTPY